jgi:hypothetical protein
MRKELDTCDRCGRHDGESIGVELVGAARKTKKACWSGDLCEHCQDSVHKAILRAVKPSTETARKNLAERKLRILTRSAARAESKEAPDAGAQPGA